MARAIDPREVLRVHIASVRGRLVLCQLAWVLCANASISFAVLLWPAKESDCTFRKLVIATVAAELALGVELNELMVSVAVVTTSLQ